MFILKVPPNLITHKMTTKRPLQGKLFIEPFFHIYGGGNIYLDRDIKNQEAMLTFLREQDARHGSSECRPGLNCAFNNSNPNRKKGKVCIFKGYISTKGISAISTINAPKLQQSAGTWKFASNATFSSREAPLHYIYIE